MQILGLVQVRYQAGPFNPIDSRSKRNKVTYKKFIIRKKNLLLKLKLGMYIIKILPLASGWPPEVFESSFGGMFAVLAAGFTEGFST